jgi:hypothetical protein
MFMQRVFRDTENNLHQPDAGSVQIPISDPQAALKFCQTLAQSLTKQMDGASLSQVQLDLSFGYHPPAP